MLERASFPRRLVAISIDWAIAVLTSALFAPIGSNELAPAAGRLGIFVLEVGLLTALLGSSIGQRIMGIRVVSWPEGYFLRPKYAFLRTILIALVVPAVIIGADGRGLHERLTRSAVVPIR